MLSRKNEETSAETSLENASLPPGVPLEAAAFLQEVGYLQPDRLQVGDTVPQLVLRRLHNEVSSDEVVLTRTTSSEISEITDASVIIGASDTLLPTVLIFGSYT